MLICALNTRVKVYKNRNIIFNDIKNLKFGELNIIQVQ
jgi:hypothetical protein